MKIQKFRTPIHTAHTSKFFDVVVVFAVDCGCVYTYILAGCSIDVCCFDFGSDYHYKILVHRVWGTCTAGCYTFQCIYLIRLCSFMFSLSRSLIHPLLRTLFLIAPWMSERASVSCVCVLVSLCMCICELQIPVGIFSVEHISYTIQTAINGHSERSRYIKVSILYLYTFVYFNRMRVFHWNFALFLCLNCHEKLITSISLIARENRMCYV